jgi:3-hydroxyacyl-CoA dehydrogenase
MTTPITRLAIIGAGVIGTSWAAAFLARGMDVVASDPAPGAEEALLKTVDALRGLPSTVDASVPALRGNCGLVSW